ncbi:helix-turn-helix domain-containing protein [Solirubrobacter ginsenosidimutans]|uniref:Helix-turn-helix domain-containing protein n=1 Tax=Solirubrobacter ginsenosidimutans TaxID=490573 RepID=A0A9X3MSX9_9ACTN|nr:helix-turn-helix domain-containing protein [Solirubrobacter ginsenosidimutans]MDA0161802.1 helix-turn-helix domain-containing protein [Solirubrobacter ginsenosidimutans]
MNLAALRGDMSVLELSRRSGVARNTIAALERGEGNPTIDTLYALADALGVALSDLLVERSAPEAVAVVRAGAGLHVEGAAIDADLLERIERPGLLAELYAIRFHAGEARHAQPHPFGVEERLHVVSGRVRVGPVGSPVELGPGDYATYSGAVPHLYEALDGPASGTLLILTPGRFAR